MRLGVGHQKFRILLNLSKKLGRYFQAIVGEEFLLRKGLAAVDYLNDIRPANIGANFLGLAFLLLYSIIFLIIVTWVIGLQ